MTKLKMRKIARWLVRTGYRNTMSGNYHIGFDEVAEKFKIPVSEVINNKKQIGSYVDESNKILSETWLEEDFDMLFCGVFE